MADGLDRRSFIKACAGVSVAGAAVAAGLGMAVPISDVPVELRAIRYPAIKVLKGSPAPYGLPLVPLRIGAGGELIGRSDADPDQLAWYKYCSHERAPGTEPGFSTSEELYYFVTEEKIAKGFNAWYKDRINEPVHVADFPPSEPLQKFKAFPGVGAAFKWRSDGVDAEDTITGIVIRCPEDQLQFEGSIPEPQREAMLDSWFPQDPADPSHRFVAFCSFCTHFCCVPGFHEAELAISAGFGDAVFCTCHLSRYDPFVFTMYNRTIFVFPEEGGAAEPPSAGAGGH